MADAAVRLAAHADVDIAVPAEQMTRDRAEQREDETGHQTDRVDNRYHNDLADLLLLKVKTRPPANASRKRKVTLLFSFITLYPSNLTTAKNAAIISRENRNRLPDIFGVGGRAAFWT
jgi:hypothetical protein